MQEQRTGIVVTFPAPKVRLLRTRVSQPVCLGELEQRGLISTIKWAATKAGAAWEKIRDEVLTKYDVEDVNQIPRNKIQEVMDYLVQRTTTRI